MKKMSLSEITNLFENTEDIQFSVFLKNNHVRFYKLLRKINTEEWEALTWLRNHYDTSKNVYVSVNATFNVRHIKLSKEKTISF